MKLDVTYKFRTIGAKREEDKFLKDGQGELVLMKSVCIGALLGPGPRCKHCGIGQFPADTLEGNEKLSRYQLAQKLNAAETEVELTAKQITTLKTLIAKAYSTLIVGQAWEQLDPAEATEASGSKEKPAE